MKPQMADFEPRYSQANAAIPANSLEQYVYAIQEVFNNTNEPTTLVQNSTSSGGGGFLSRISGFVGASPHVWDWQRESCCAGHQQLILAGLVCMHPCHGYGEDSFDLTSA